MYWSMYLHAYLNQDRYPTYILSGEASRVVRLRVTPPPGPQEWTVNSITYMRHSQIIFFVYQITWTSKCCFLVCNAPQAPQSGQL